MSTKKDKAKGKAKTKRSTAEEIASATATGLETIGVIRPASDGIPPFHPLADVDPLIDGADYAALVENIRVRGLRERVVLYQGKILDGRNRARACAEAGVDLLFTEMSFGSDADATAYLDSANLHRRHLTLEQKNGRIAARLKASPTTSDRQIAKQTGASHTHVTKKRRELEKTGDVATVATSTDTKGRQQPRRRSKSATAKTATATYASRATKPAEQSVSAGAGLDLSPELAAYVAADKAWKLGEPEPITPALQDGASAGEDVRLRARVGELNDEVRRLEIKANGLEAENSELARAVEIVQGTIEPEDVGRALWVLISFGRIKLQDFVVSDIEALNPTDILELAKNLTDIAGDIKREKRKAAKAKPEAATS